MPSLLVLVFLKMNLLMQRIDSPLTDSINSTNTMIIVKTIIFKDGQEVQKQTGMTEIKLTMNDAIRSIWVMRFSRITILN